MAAARQSIEIDATPDQVFAVIVDFDKYPLFVPNQSAVRVIESSDDRWLVEFELAIIKTLRYTLELKATGNRTLRWTLVRGDMMKTNEGGWALEALPGDRTRATYEIDVKLKGFVPKSVSNLLIDKTLPENLKAFKRETERRN